MARTAGFGAKDASGNFYFKAVGDGEIVLGNSSDDIIQITGSVEQQGTSLKISGDDARIKINGDTDSHPGLEFLENGSRHWIIYNDYTTDNLTFKSSADRVVITDSGRLGIGTTSPDYKLDVAGNISINEHIYHNGDSNTRFSFPGNDEVNIVAGGNSVFKFASNTIILNNANENHDTKIMADNGQVVLHVDAGNNRVGIGTTTPSVELDVRGNLQLYGDAPTVTVKRDNNADASTLQFQGSGGVVGAYLKFLGDETAAGGTNNDLALGTGATVTERMRIRGDGKIGIGTTSPSVDFDVNGTTKSNYYITTPGTQDLGSSTSSALSISAGVMILDADSITGNDAGGGNYIHTLVIPDGSTNGQRLTLIVNTTFGSSNNIMIMPTGNIGGAVNALVPSSKTSVEYIWYGSSWFEV